METVTAHRRWTWVVIAVGLVAGLVAAIVRIALGPGVPDARASGTVPPSTGSSPPILDTWTGYGPPDGSFRVVGPSSPRESLRQASFGTIHQTRFSSPDGEVYGVEWFDVSTQVVAGTTDAQLVDAWATNVLGNLGGQIDEEDILKDGPYSGVGLRVVNGDTTYLLRVFAAHGVVLEAAASFPSDASDEAAARRFIGSLEILVP
jgi:hypothetical protein